MEGLSEKEKGLMDMDNSVVIAGGLGLREMNGKGEKTQSRLILKKEEENFTLCDTMERPGEHYAK